MKKDELKKMLKPVIRQCLAEIFMEMNLETIVEGVVSRKMPSNSGRRPQSFEPEIIAESRGMPVEEQETPEMRRAKMMDKLGISEDEWSSMYAGTEPMSDEGTNPEHVSENTLRQSGLYKDYSKFVK